MARPRFRLSTRSLILIKVVATCLSGCTIFGLDAEEGEVVAPTYSLRAGPQVVYPEPLPALTPIYIDRMSSDGKQTSRLGFRGWDFDHDGRFEMVEVLGYRGQLIERLYDLNFDGIVNWQMRRGGSPNPPAPQPSPDDDDSKS